MVLIRVLPGKESSLKLYLTPEVMEQFGFKSGDLVKVRAGSSVTEAEIAVGLQDNRISPGMLDALGLPVIKELKLRMESPRSLQIGPLIGILVSRGRKFKRPPYSSQGWLLRDFLNYASQVRGLAFVFTPEGVNPSNHTILGYFLSPGRDGKTQWAKHLFPLPDVVYNRILYRSVERKKITSKIASFLFNQKNVKYFNPKFLNKWETHVILAQNPRLREHLPVTKKHDNLDNLLKFLALYQTVYLKPVHGSLGKNIIRISLTPTGYRGQYRQGKETVTRFWSTPDELQTELTKFIHGKPYIIQQGLHLLKYRDRVFDIRVLMQKDGQGRWVDSAMVVRVGPPGGIFPNVAAGGEPRNIKVFWQELTSTDWLASRVFTVAKQISFLAAQTLEDSLGTFAEIGLDIGIDTENRVWLIEINSKPSRKVFPKDQPDLKRNSISLPIDFAAYLAGFRSAQEQSRP